MDALDQRLSQRFIALDPSGYFLIKLDRDAAELVLEHYGNTIDDKGLARDSETGEVLRCDGGNAPRRPSAVYGGSSWASSSRKGKPHTQSVHRSALYLGRELQKAEQCLRDGTWPAAVL